MSEYEKAIETANGVGGYGQPIPSEKDERKRDEECTTVIVCGNCGNTYTGFYSACPHCGAVS